MTVKKPRVFLNVYVLACVVAFVAMPGAFDPAYLVAAAIFDLALEVSLWRRQGEPGAKHENPAE